jgi:glycosyltransferase involved in cell wall biosynthesis
LLLYRAELGIDAERLHYIPLGDWRKARAGQPLVQRSIWGDYYFAGGRSNRDYGALVEAFRTIPAKLLIVCSHSNLEDLETSALPDNISVVCDVSAAKFDEMISCAKAGIIPLRHDTGSAGQSVALTLMRHAKCVLATRVGALLGYVEHGVSGYWFDDAAEDLPGLIRCLEEQAGLAKVMGCAALRQYEEHFSLSIAMAAFENILASVPLPFCGPEIESDPDPTLKSQSTRF